MRICYPHPCGNALLPVRICYPRLFFILCILFKEIMDPLSKDPFDPQSLRLPAEMIGKIVPRKRPPRHGGGERFLKGPIPWAWWSTACRLPGQALQVASAVRYQAGCTGPKEIRLGLADLDDDARSRISPRLGPPWPPSGARTGRTGLRLPSESGSKPVVGLLGSPSRPGPDRSVCRLYGPIPWAWWLNGTCPAPRAGPSRSPRPLLVPGWMEQKTRGRVRASGLAGVGELWGFHGSRLVGA